MLKTYLVTYWTNNGQKAGMQVSAQSALDARNYAESLPDFKTIITYPKEVK